MPMLKFVVNTGTWMSSGLQLEGSRSRMSSNKNSISSVPYRSDTELMYRPVSDCMTKKHYTQGRPFVHSIATLSWNNPRIFHFENKPPAFHLENVTYNI